MPKIITMKLFSVLAALTAPTVAARSFGGYAAFAAITPDSKIPDVNLHSGFPPTFVNMAHHTVGRKVFVVGLPGAFTPT
jgi:hypothetical protein